MPRVLRTLEPSTTTSGGRIQAPLTLFAVFQSGLLYFSQRQYARRLVESYMVDESQIYCRLRFVYEHFKLKSWTVFLCLLKVAGFTDV